MKTYELLTDSGEFTSFEVNNLFLGRRGAARVVRHIKGATITFGPRLFSIFQDGPFLTFELNGKKFEIWEPFEDNSRYHIAQIPASNTAELVEVKNAFAAYRPWLLRWLRG